MIHKAKKYDGVYKDYVYKKRTFSILQRSRSTSRNLSIVIPTYLCPTRSKRRRGGHVMFIPSMTR